MFNDISAHISSLPLFSHREYSRETMPQNFGFQQQGTDALAQHCCIPHMLHSSKNPCRRKSMTQMSGTAIETDVTAHRYSLGIR